MVEYRSRANQAEMVEPLTIGASADMTWMLGALVGGDSVRSKGKTHSISITDSSVHV